MTDRETIDRIKRGLLATGYEPPPLPRVRLVPPLERWELVLWITISFLTGAVLVVGLFLWLMP